MTIKESGEMYLESIYLLHKLKNTVRSVDIAEQMNFSRASVSRGVNLLKNKVYLKWTAMAILHLPMKALKWLKNL